MFLLDNEFITMGLILHQIKIYVYSLFLTKNKVNNQAVISKTYDSRSN